MSDLDVKRQEVIFECLMFKGWSIPEVEFIFDVDFDYIMKMFEGYGINIIFESEIAL